MRFSVRTIACFLFYLTHLTHRRKARRSSHLDRQDDGQGARADCPRRAASWFYIIALSTASPIRSPAADCANAIRSGAMTNIYQPKPVDRMDSPAHSYLSSTTVTKYRVSSDGFSGVSAL